MPKIVTYHVKGKVGDNGKITLDHSTKELIDDGSTTDFDEAKIALKAQEVSNFNKTEQSMCEQMGKGEYTVEYKLIV